jgi:hypothetical protein
MSALEMTGEIELTVNSVLEYSLTYVVRPILLVDENIVENV